MARLRVGLLAPSTHADRVIEVLVPDGVRCVADGPDAVAEARIEVLAPQQFEQLRLLLERMQRPDNPPHGWVRKQLAELAVVKLHAAIHCLRHHYQTGTEEGTERLLAALRELREPLDAEAHGRPADLGRPWAAARELLPDRLLRRLDRSTTDPGSIRFRATAIEEFTLRSEPTEAYVELVVAAGDSPTLGTARAVNGINVLVLVGVVALLGGRAPANELARRHPGHAADDLPDPAGQPAGAARLDPAGRVADHAALPGRPAHRGAGAGAGRRAGVRAGGLAAAGRRLRRGRSCSWPATCGSARLVRRTPCPPGRAGRG